MLVYKASDTESQPSLAPGARGVMSDGQGGLALSRRGAEAKGPRRQRRPALQEEAGRAVSVVCWAGVFSTLQERAGEPGPHVSVVPVCARPRALCSSRCFNESVRCTPRPAFRGVALWPQDDTEPGRYVGRALGHEGS